MGERKVLNKYYPPDMDPSKRIRVPKSQRRGPKAQIKSRVMLPFSLQCLSCSDFVFRGTKFNARKEWSGEDYLGIKIWRFYLRCPNCAAELTFKTDPKNSSYTCERGAVRTFEKMRKEAEKAKELEAKEDAEMDDMQKLESRTEANKRELEAQDMLEELRERAGRNAHVDLDRMIEVLLDEPGNDAVGDVGDDSSADFVRRIDDSQLERDEDRPSFFGAIASSSASSTSASKRKSTDTSRVIRVKKKPKSSAPAPPSAAAPPSSALAALAGYDDSSSSSSSDSE